MKHAARAIPVLAGILAAVLAGCAARVPPPDDIQLTRRSATADDWSRHLPDLYRGRSEEHTSELQSLMRISYAVFCLKKKKQQREKSCNDYMTQHHSRHTTHAQRRHPRK